MATNRENHPKHESVPPVQVDLDSPAETGTGTGFAAHWPVCAAAAIVGVLLGGISALPASLFPAVVSAAIHTVFSSFAGWGLAAMIMGYWSRTWLVAAVSGVITLVSAVVFYYATTLWFAEVPEATLEVIQVISIPWLVLGSLGGIICGEVGWGVRNYSKPWATFAAGAGAAAILSELTLYTTRWWLEDWNQYVWGHFISLLFVLVPAWLVRPRIKMSLAVLWTLVLTPLGIAAVYGFFLFIKS